MVLDEIAGKYNSSDSVEEWLTWLPILHKGYDISCKKQTEKDIDVVLNSTENVTSWIQQNTQVVNAPKIICA